MEPILSTGERDVAERLARGESVDAIAAARGTSEAQVEQSIERIRDKTDRAIATLLASPVAEEAVSDLSSDQRAALRAILA